MFAPDRPLKRRKEFFPLCILPTPDTYPGLTWDLQTRFQPVHSFSQKNFHCSVSEDIFVVTQNHVLIFLNAAWDGMTMAFFSENTFYPLDRILRKY